MEIDKIFFDKNNYIYIFNSNILYFYDDGILYPFLEKMDNVHNCFSMEDGNFYVHTSNTINIFDKNFHKINDNFMSNNIDSVCYNTKNDIIVTLEKGEVCTYFFVTQNGRIFKTSLSQIYAHNTLFDDVKIFRDYIIMFQGGLLYIFHLQKHMMEFLTQTHIDKSVYLNICDYHDNTFTLSNGDILSLDGTYIEKNGNHRIDTNVYDDQEIFFVLRGTKLFCYYKSEKMDTIIKPLMMVLGIDKIELHTNLAILEKNVEFSIMNNGISQILLIKNKAYLVENVLCEINFDVEHISYDNINCIEKINTDFIIDIIVDQSHIRQLMDIIPSIYRLNNDFYFNFEQLDENGRVLCYGDGVTRQVFNNASTDLDNILKNKFETYSSFDVNRLGKLLYFCNIEGDQLFNNLHPYFFYKLSSVAMDHIILIKKFREDIHYRQYKLYQTCPEMLAEANMNMKTVDEYVAYIFSCDLSDQQKKMYDEFVNGYCSFMSKHKHYEFIKNFSINYFIKQLVRTNKINVEFNFSMMNKSINEECFKKFKKCFKMCFSKLSNEDIMKIVQNITGSQYFMGIINVIFAYGDDKMKIEYHISTCASEIIINVDPTNDNIVELFSTLVIYDREIRN